MISTLLIRAQLTGKRIARRAVFGTLGGIFALVGLGFLAAAGLIFLISLYGAIAALLMVGGAFILVGLIVIGFSRIPPRVVDRKTADALSDPTKATRDIPGPGKRPTALTAETIAEAFILGLTVARSIGRKD